MANDGGKNAGGESNSIMLAGTEKSSVGSLKHGRFSKASPDGLMKITMKSENKKEKLQATQKRNPKGSP